MSFNTSANNGWRRAVAGSFLSLAFLYAALFGAYGTESPFFPSLLRVHGLSPREIGEAFAAGTLVRLSVGPLFGLAADRFGARGVLALAAVAASLLILLYLNSIGFWPLLLVSIVHSVATAPLSPLADVLALEASAREGTFRYGWVRGIGSAAFICGTIASGTLVAHWGVDSILISSALLFFAMVVPLHFLAPVDRQVSKVAWSGLATLFAIPAFRHMLLVAGLVIGSHATSDAFAVIQWRTAEIGAEVTSVLWSVAVASEIVVFFFLGPWLLLRYGTARCAAISAFAGVVRWSTLAITSNVMAVAIIQTLHGLTFSLMHLVCMQIIFCVVPERLLATAQTLYGTFWLGLASASLTLLSGELYDVLGPRSFWVMTTLCALALTLTKEVQCPNTQRHIRQKQSV